MEEISLHIPSQHLPAVLTIFLTIVGYNTYWFIAKSPGLRKKIKERYSAEASSIRLVQFQYYVGFLFLGVIPLVVCVSLLDYSLADYGISFQSTGQSMLWIIGLSAIIFPLNINASKRPENLETYPMIRAKEWNKRLILLNSLANMSYLLAYEILFRGLLLFTCVDILGVWPAVAVNVALYSAVHLPKGPAETIGAIPFGLIICYITLSTGTIWVAVVIHWVLSLSNDYLSVYHNPEMRFKGSS